MSPMPTLRRRRLFGPLRRLAAPLPNIVRKTPNKTIQRMEGMLLNELGVRRTDANAHDAVHFGDGALCQRIECFRSAIDAGVEVDHEFAEQRIHCDPMANQRGNTEIRPIEAAEGGFVHVLPFRAGLDNRTMAEPVGASSSGRGGAAA